MKIEKLFDVYNSKSEAFEDHANGTIPFITNGKTSDASVIGFVEPRPKDKIIMENSICLSSFCQPIIIPPPFIARGNGGSGLVILTPLESLPLEELYFYASQLNCYKWKFSYSRQVLIDRIKKLDLIEYKDIGLNIKREIEKILPTECPSKNDNIEHYNYKKIEIQKIFNLIKGDFKSLKSLFPGKIPTVSRKGIDNGITGYYSKPDGSELFSKGIITVSSLEGDAFIQVEDFIASDKVLILKPKLNLRLTTLFYIQYMINSEKWRFTYNRESQKTRFSLLKIFLPLNEKSKNSLKIDEDYIQKIVEDSYGWEIVKSQFF